jgi:uncharacterized protein with PQ loop repeat
MFFLRWGNDVPSDTVVALANVMQVCVPVLSMTGYVPQWVALMKTKSSDEISVQSWVIWVIAMFFALFYAIVQFQINGRGWPLIISSGGSFLFVAITLLMVLYYRRPRLLQSNTAE